MPSAAYQLHILNTVRYLILPVLLGPVLFLAGLASFAGSGKLDALLCMLGGAYVCAIGASIVWTRIVCKHFYIPKDGGQEEVVFTRGDLAKLVR